MTIAKRLLAASALALAAVSTPAAASNPVQTGIFQGQTWTAQSNIVGQASTATLAGGGSPINFAQGPKYQGVVSLIMEYENGDAFICSGSLLSDRRSILTAGHCVSGGAGTANPFRTTAYFNDLSNPDSVTFLDTRSVGVDVTKYFVNPNYTGEVVDQNDIAVLRLDHLAPSFATSYELYTGPDLTGQRYNIAGYGARSDVGGLIGDNLSPGRLRQGDNRFDFRLGDSDFDGFFTDPGADGEKFFGTADVNYTYLSDFDPGVPQYDASCQLATLGFGLDASGKYCNLGVGALEVSSAGGDSGGPQFIDGKLASVTSFGLTFGTTFGDFDDALNSSWGEFNGFVPTSIHTGFIAFAMGVPEPSTWMLLTFGFGMIGGGLRKRRRLEARFARI